MILVFAGSGASAAVDPDFLTTVKFFDQLPREIKQDELFKDTLGFIRQGVAANLPPDIEHILWALDELDNFSTIKSNDLSGHLIKSNLISKYSNNNKFDVTFITANLAAVNARARGLILKINRVVHDVYAKDPDNLDFNENWYPLLKNIKRLGEKIELFTTNYDLILEKVISDIRISVDSGRSTGTIKRLRSDLWKEPDYEHLLSNNALLTKLHGSIDWIRHRSGAIEFTTEFIQHDRQAIIYPGFKGVPTEEPFISFHRYLEAIVRNADAVIFIGYAFRDGYINSIFRNRIQPNAPIYVIGLGPRPTDIPFGNDRYEYWDTGFNSQSAFEVIQRLELSLKKQK